MSGSERVPPNASLNEKLEKTTHLTSSGKQTDGENASEEMNANQAELKTSIDAVQVSLGLETTKSADATIADFLNEIDNAASGRDSEIIEETASISDFYKGEFFDPARAHESDKNAISKEVPLPIDPELEQLRQLLFSREISTLRELHHRLTDSNAQTQDLSRIIGNALLRLRTTEEQAKLKAALRETVEDIVVESAQRDPKRLADHIFPIMGPAIRRAISETFLSMLQNFNKSLEISFTLKGLRWRFEALRTGKSFSEIVLLHTLIYRVEQIFLVHAETGIVLQHLVNEGVDSQDADLVSSMLSVVQDFVRDCFVKDQKDNSSLDNMQLGEHTIFVERSPMIYLAYVVRGTPPITLREEFRDMLAVAAAESSVQLRNFDGDTSFFKCIRRHFEKFLVAHYINDGKKAPFLIRYASVTLLLALLGGAVYGVWGFIDQEKRFHQAVVALDETAGIVVTSVSPSMLGAWRISLFRDDLAPDSVKILTDAGMPEDRFELHATPYVSLDNSIVRERVRNAIHPIEGVELRFDENHILYMTGSAKMGWIIDAKERALATAGVKGVDISGIADPRMNELRELVRNVEAATVRFVSGQNIPIPEDQKVLANAVNDLAALEKLGAAMDIAVSLVIYGHADATGNEKANYDISQKRAQILAAMLYARGSSMPIALYGLGADYAVRQDGKTQADQDSRRIELHVKLMRNEGVNPDLREE